MARRTTSKPRSSTRSTASTKRSTRSRKTSSKSSSTTKSTAGKARDPKRSRKILEKIGVWSAIFLVTLVGIDYAVQYLNYRASVAIVNGERIYKGDFIEKLQDSYGASIVSQMIDERLIYQEAEELDVVISDDDIDAEIDGLEEQYGGEEAFQSELDARDISNEELRQQIETTLLVETMLLDDITISDEEKKDFYDQYKDQIIPGNEDPTYEEAEEQIEETLRDQKITQNVQGWLTELRDNATIKNNIEEPKDYSFLGITRAFFSELIGG